MIRLVLTSHNQLRRRDLSLKSHLKGQRSGIPELVGLRLIKYCKTFNICDIKVSRFNEYDISVYFNFGGLDIHVAWLQIKKKI